jgi:hypothetical protein
VRVYGTPKDESNFHSSKYLMSLRECAAQPIVILIDGTDDWRLKERRRAYDFRLAENVIEPAAIIILVDSWAYKKFATIIAQRGWRGFMALVLVAGT